MSREYLTERVGLFSLLRSLYTYPLRADTLDVIRRLKDIGPEPMERGLEKMRSHLDTGWSGSHLEALNIEMTRLIEGPGLTPAVPYASYYLHDGRMMGPAALAVRRLYHAWQAVPVGDARLPDDHIALELGFLAYLAERAAEDPMETTKALQAGQELIVRHLLPWLPRFCAALAAATSTPFFRGLAELTEAAVDNDLDWSIATLAGSPGAEAALAQSLS